MNKILTVLNNVGFLIAFVGAAAVLFFTSGTGVKALVADPMLCMGMLLAITLVWFTITTIGGLHGIVQSPRRLRNDTGQDEMALLMPGCGMLVFSLALGWQLCWGTVLGHVPLSNLAFWSMFAALVVASLVQMYGTLSLVEIINERKPEPTIEEIAAEPLPAAPT